MSLHCRPGIHDLVEMSPRISSHSFLHAHAKDAGHWASCVILCSPARWRDVCALDTQHTHDVVAVGSQADYNSSASQGQNPQLNLTAEQTQKGTVAVSTTRASTTCILGALTQQTEQHGQQGQLQHTYCTNTAQASRCLYTHLKFDHTCSWSEAFGIMRLTCWSLAP
jgi:hypothetical protein